MTTTTDDGGGGGNAKLGPPTIAGAAVASAAADTGDATDGQWSVALLMLPQLLLPLQQTLQLLTSHLPSIP